jgi:hypothetical protein
MGRGHEGGDVERHGDESCLPEFSMVQEIAGAMRAEFGVAIDAHPGGVGVEAGAVNRAFRAAVEVILGGTISPIDDPDSVVTWILRRTALRRLEELGVSGPQAEALLVMEPTLGDRWLTYLALTSSSVIEDIVGMIDDPSDP